MPTAEEIAAAQQAIRDGGPGARETVALGVLCIRDPVTRDVCERIAEASGVDLGVIVGAFIAGMNLGLRVPR